jgi:hypothetical protein
MPFGYHIEDEEERGFLMTAAATGQLYVIVRMIFLILILF